LDYLKGGFASDHAPYVKTQHTQQSSLGPRAHQHQLFGRYNPVLFCGKFVQSFQHFHCSNHYGNATITHSNEQSISAPAQSLQIHTTTHSMACTTQQAAAPQPQPLPSHLDAMDAGSNQMSMMLTASPYDADTVVCSSFPLPNAYTAFDSLAPQLDKNTVCSINQLSENICNLTNWLVTLLLVIALPPTTDPTNLSQSPNQKLSQLTICSPSLQTQTSQLVNRLTSTTDHHRHHQALYNFMDIVTHHYLAHNYHPPN